MTSDPRVQRMRELLQRMLPDLGLSGLAVETVNFDFVRQSFIIALSREGRSCRLVIPVERVGDVTGTSSFALRRLRREIEDGFAA